MARVVQRSMGGEVTSEGAGRYVFTYRGRFLSFLLGLALVVWTLGIAMMIVGVATGGPMGLLGGVAIGAVFVLVVGVILRRRLRTMGVFVVDGSSGTLTRMKSEQVRATWPLGDVRFEPQWDPVHRGFERHFWLIARTPDGVGLRLAKGPRGEIDALVEELAGLR